MPRSRIICRSSRPRARSGLTARPSSVGRPSTRVSIQELTGPAGERLRAIVTPITLPGAPGGFVYTIAGPAVDVHQDVREFGAKLAVTLTVLALGLVGAVVAQVH
jgi:hypothetical protein